MTIPSYELRSNSTGTTTTHSIVTTRKIRRGHIFLSEAPLLQCPANEDPSPRAFRTLSASSQRAFLALHNCHDKLGPRQLRSTTVRGIWHTNRVVAGDSDAVFETVCRLRHSCRPNASLSWDPDAGRMEVRALKGLRLGEEVTVAYVDCNAPLKERRKRLEPWGFVCVCIRCAREESRAQRRRRK